MISQKDNFIILVNNKNDKKIVNLKHQKQIKWKKANFKLDEIFGKPYNSFFMVNSNTLSLIDNPFALEEDNESESSSISENNELKNEDEIQDLSKRDNRDLFDNNQAQVLGCEEIKKMKKEGVESNKLVQILAKNSKTFNQKTTFAQEKYISKKKKKHMLFFSVKKVTLEFLAQSHYLDSPAKLNFLRYDSLALFLQYSNIIPDSNLLIIEKTKGLILAGVAERLLNKGNITFAFYEETKKPLEQITCFHQLNLCNADNSKIILSEFDEIICKENLNSSFSHLLIAGELNPKKIVEKSLKLLESGAIIVVFSIFLEPLTEVYEFLKADKKCIMIKIFDIFTRQYQVLKDRTHPQVNMEGFSGFILTATKLSQ